MQLRNVLRRIGVMVLAGAVSVANGVAADWPNWRGPEGTGTNRTATPPTTWSERENVKWKVPISGTGQSTPVIWGDQIFLLTASEADGGSWNFDVVCMGRTDGAIRWRQTAASEVPAEGHHPTGSFAAYSAVTDGEYVWAGFGSRGLHCYTVGGKHLWSTSLPKMQIKRSFGEASSPLLVEDAIVVLQDHEGPSRIAAYDKMTGKLRWETPRDEGTTWSSPMAITVDGRTEIVTNATSKIRSYDLANGDLRWECSGMTSNVIPTPAFGNGMVYCASGFRGYALMAIKLGHTGDLTGTDAIAWTVTTGTPYVSSPLLYQDRLFFVDTLKSNLTCVDAKTGQIVYERKSIDGLKTIYASPVGAGDHVYLADREGSTAVLTTTEDAKVVALNVLDDTFDATPVAVGKELYLRGSKHLYCIAGS